jgi:hypothetical protein
LPSLIRDSLNIFHRLLVNITPPLGVTDEFSDIGNVHLLAFKRLQDGFQERDTFGVVITHQ